MSSVWCKEYAKLITEWSNYCTPYYLELVRIVQRSPTLWTQQVNLREHYFIPRNRTYIKFWTTVWTMNSFFVNQDWRRNDYLKYKVFQLPSRSSSQVSLTGFRELQQTFSQMSFGCFYNYRVCVMYFLIFIGRF